MKLNSQSFQLTVVPLWLPGMDFWRATRTQHMVRKCSTAVTQVWFQRRGWILYALWMGGVRTLLIWAVL